MPGRADEGEEVSSGERLDFVMSTQEQLLSLINELNSRIDSMFGLFYDARLAMNSYADRFEESQILMNSQLGDKFTLEELDTLRFLFGDGSPDDPNVFVTHVVTQDEFKSRNRFGGQNQHAVSQAVINFVYSIWNDEYRPKIARILSINVKLVESDIFVDIRLIRNSIIHHSNIALAGVERCRIIKFFKE